MPFSLPFLSCCVQKLSLAAFFFVFFLEFFHSFGIAKRSRSFYIVVVVVAIVSMSSWQFKVTHVCIHVVFLSPSPSLLGIDIFLCVVSRCSHLCFKINKKNFTQFLFFFSSCSSVFHSTHNWNGNLCKSTCEDGFFFSLHFILYFIR